MPNSTVHMHQPMGGAQGQASDIEIAAREIIRMQDKIRVILSNHTGQTYEKVARDTDRDYYLAADQALEYGIIDEVLGLQGENDSSSTNGDEKNSSSTSSDAQGENNSSSTSSEEPATQ